MSALAASQTVPTVFDGIANTVAVVVLLLEFGMLRATLLRSQVRLYAGQSLAVSVLAAVVAYGRDVPELYALAVLSLLLKVVVVPLVVLALLRDAHAEIAGSGALGVRQPGAGGDRRRRIRVLLGRRPRDALIGAAHHRAEPLGGRGPGRVRADDHAPRRRQPGDWVLLLGERRLAGQPRGRRRHAADSRSGVPVRPARRCSGLRRTDAHPSPPHPLTVHRNPRPVEGIATCLSCSCCSWWCPRWPPSPASWCPDGWPPR